MNALIMKVVSSVIIATLVIVQGCAPTPSRPASGHLKPAPITSGIPGTVSGLPIVPPPKPAHKASTYSLVVTDVPVKELLFSMARDAHLNIDIHPGLKGQVTLNALDQTVPQILERIAAQVPIRYHFDNELLVIEPDKPYLQMYRIDYVNLTRSSKSSNSIATQIASTGQSAVEGSDSNNSSTGSSSGNNSVTEVTSLSENPFWETLRRNIINLLGLGSDKGAGEANVIVNRSAGILSVRAPQHQQQLVRTYIDRLMNSAQRQVLIEATVVEVQLKNDYQFGVDWSRLADRATGLSLTQGLLGTNLANAPHFILSFGKKSDTAGDISSTVKMLQEFGNVKVLSSPKIMAINNQTALLKVVDNLVYFTIEADTTLSQTVSQTTFTTTPHSVPIGFVMSVTPQIGKDQNVTMNVRPTISRVIGFVNDPNPALAQSNIDSKVPQIQVREMESVLRIHSGQTAVLGGLIQDSIDLSDRGLPGLSRIKGIGNAFNYRDNKIKKTELVIFLRPRVITNLHAPLDVYAEYLPKPGQPLAPAHANDSEVWQ